MRLGTKILLLMLLITVSTSVLLAYLVTKNIATYETERANDRISAAIDGYVAHVESRHAQIQKIVRALLEAPAPRSQLQAVDDGADPAAIEQLKLELLGRTVQTELSGPEGNPAFHVLINAAGETLVAVAPGNPALEAALMNKSIRWNAEPMLADDAGPPVRQYVSANGMLLLAMGVPLHTQIGGLPSHAYFVGFQIDDDWIRRQLLTQRRIEATAETTAAGRGTASAPVSAWFLVNNTIVARGGSIDNDPRITQFTPAIAPRILKHLAGQTTRAMTTYDLVDFDLANEHYHGQQFDLELASSDPSTPITRSGHGRLLLASSLDESLIPLRRVQWQIGLTTAVAILLAAIACQILAARIVKPIHQLVDGTERIARGEFDNPVSIQRKDELGLLAVSFNEMAQGLKERQTLREERVKIERDLALARKIQMDVLPKRIPPCPGYDIAGYSLPAEQTGGDIYDLVAVALDDDAASGTCPPLLMLLADATGHGVGPALSVTQVRAMLRMGVRLRAQLDHLFAQINRQLCQDLDSAHFVTAFLGLLDPNTHTITYHSAGQAPLLHLSAATATARWLDSSTIPFGIDEEPETIGVQQISLAAGDLFVLLTDGFYEYRNTAREEFGNDRVAAIIAASAHKPAKEILADLLAETARFANGATQNDDMTAVVIKRI